MHLLQQLIIFFRWSLSFWFISGTLFTSTVSAQFSNVVNVPPNDVPDILGTDTQLNLADGGVLPSHFDVGDPAGTSTNVELNILGGRTGDYLQVNRNGTVNIAEGYIGLETQIGRTATVSVSGGEVGGLAVIGRGGTLEVTDGVVGAGLVAGSNSTLTISGGRVGGLRAASGSRVTISGGSMAVGFRADSGSVLTISGGSFDSGISSGSSTNFRLQGGEFRVNGETVPGLLDVGSSMSFQFGLGDNLISGTLADGTPFVFGLSVSGVSRLVVETVELPLPGPAIINATTDELPRGIREDQTLIVSDGGIVPRSFRAGWGSTVTVEPGGNLGDNFEAGGAILNINGGVIGHGFEAVEGSVVTISGGSFGDNLTVGSTSLRPGGVGGSLDVLGGSFGDGVDAPRFTTISGSDFRRNGELIAGLDNDGDSLLFDLPINDLFTGTLSDGTPFAFSDEDSVQFELMLERTALPPIGASVITASTDQVPLGIRAGQHVIVDGDGLVPDNFNAGFGSRVTVEPGGTVGKNFEAVNAEVTVTGGSIGDRFDAYAGSNVTISGGSWGHGFQTYRDSVVEISGGAFGDRFESESLSKVTFVGNGFRFDGVPIDDLASVGDIVKVNVARNRLFTGTFADGTPFAFLYNDDIGDSFAGNTLSLEIAELPIAEPSLITASTDEVPLGVRDGQTLLVDNGGTVPDHFNAGRGSTVRIESGGVIGENFEAVDAAIIISGGTIGQGFDVFNGSTVTLSGGTIGDHFQAFEGSEIHMIGSEFFLDGLSIPELTNSGDSVLLDDREAILTGTLQDGTDFGFYLNTDEFWIAGRDYFDPNATLRLTLTNAAPLDCDFDSSTVCDLADMDMLLAVTNTNDLAFDLDGSGAVDTQDIATWLAGAGNANIGRPYLSGDASLDGNVDAIDLNRVGKNWLLGDTSWSEGDFNGDGNVDALDLNQVGKNWQKTAESPIAASVPEPSGWLMGIAGLLLLMGKL